MRHILYKFIILFLLSQSSLSGDLLAKDSVEKQKKISRSFNIGNQVKVSLQNQFGKVHVNTWDKKTLQVDITIIVEKNSEAKAQELLDRIDVAIDEQSNLISFRTMFEGSINNKGGEHFEINYVVNMPKSNPLELENKFGDVYLADFNGPLNLKVSYGQLKAGTITHKDVSTRLEFGGGQIASQEGGALVVKYSKLNVDKLGNVSLENQFSDIIIGTSGNMELNSKYGDLQIGQSGNLSGKVSFSEFRLARMNESLNLDASYVNQLTIEKVDKGFERIEINGSFCSYKIYLPSGISCNAQLTTKFGDVKYNKEKINFNYINKGNTTSEYRGKIGTGTPTSDLLIDSSYGTIELIIVD